MPQKGNRDWLLGGSKVAHFVEDVVSGQQHLGLHERDAAVFEQRGRIHDRLAGLGFGGSHEPADDRDSTRLGGNAFRRLTIARHKRRPLHQIARRITADGKFGKQDQAGASSPRPARKVDYLGSVAGEISNGRIDLSQRDLHTSSVKRECAGAKSGGDWTADLRLQVSDLTTDLTRDFQSEDLQSQI